MINWSLGVSLSSFKFSSLYLCGYNRTYKCSRITIPCFAFLSRTGSTQTGPTGPIGPEITGPTGADSLITGPTGAFGTGPTGAFGTGPTGSVITGPTGANSLITGPTGVFGTEPTGVSIIGPTGAASNITGPTGTVLSSGSVLATYLGSGAVTSANIASGQIGGNHFAIPIANVKFQNIRETMNNIGTISGDYTIYMASGNVVMGTVNGSGVWYVADPPVSGDCGIITMILNNGGTATRVWPSGTIWPATSAPVLTASGTDVISLLTVNSGGTWRGIGNVNYAN